MDAKLERSILTQAAQAGRVNSDAGVVPEVEGFNEAEVFAAASQLHSTDFIDAAVGRGGQQPTPETVRLVDITALGQWRLDTLQRSETGPDGASSR
jgi:hypothetical protein